MSRTQKIILASLVAITLVSGIAWKVAAPRVIAGVQGLLLAEINSSIIGRLEIGSIDFSILGAAVLHEVTLFDKADQRVASSKAISVSYKFRDLLGGRFGIDSVKTITVDNISLNLTIDKNGRWNLQDLVKPQAERTTVFAGSIVISEGNIVVATSAWKREITAVSGEIDYSASPAVGVDIKGKMGTSAIAAKGTWVSDGKTQLALKSDTFELVEAQALLPAASGGVKLSAGTLKDVQATVVLEKSGFQTTGEASLSGLAVELQGMALKDGTAKLKLQGKLLTVTEGSVTADGNKLSVGGTMDFSKPSPGLALNISSSGLDIASLSSPKASLSGAASFQAEVTGFADKPVARGNFSLASGQFDSNPIADAGGFFNFAGDTLTIDNAKANALGGGLTISGTVVPKTSRYNLKIAGQNVDAAILTNKALSGRMDFAAGVIGQGNAESMTADGVFTIKSGTLSEYTITDASGGFRKQGNRLDLSNVGVTLSGQRLMVSGAITLASAGVAPQLNLNVSSAGVNTSVFNPNSALKGMIAVQAIVTGTSDKNQVRGNFQIAAGSLGQLAFSGASGGFNYAEGLLTLIGGRAHCLAGTILLNGTVIPKTMEYHQQVTGQNIDAAQVTDRDVQGRADFNATISGVGDWDKANGDGSFKMNAGSVKGISFNGLTGNFSKRGMHSEFTGLKFNMLGGLASGTGATEGEFIHLIITPNAIANTVLGILTGKTLAPQDLRIRFRGPNG